MAWTEFEGDRGERKTRKRARAGDEGSILAIARRAFLASAKSTAQRPALDAMLKQLARAMS